MTDVHPGPANPTKPALAFVALFAATALLAAFEPLRLAVETLRTEGAQGATLDSLLLLPAGVVAIVIFRLVIGLETFGLFAPLILAFAFAKVSPLIGVAVFGVLLVLVSPVGLWLARFPLLSTARTASLLVLSSLLLLCGFALFNALGGQLRLIDLGLPVVALSGMMDRFVSAQLDQSPQEALKLSIYTLLVSTLVAIGVIGNPWLLELLRAHPDLLLFCFPLCLLLGRYSGLRVMEVWRFRVLARAS